MCEIAFEEITYPSADGQNTVHAYLWIPAGEPKGIIQLSHGMCEYVLRYDAWARRFAKAGYIFCGNDHLGHGHTAKNSACLGYTAPRGGAELLVADLFALTKIMKERFPALPVVLYGHSMGSFVARCYLTLHGKELAAALISGTGGPEQPTGVARTLARAIGGTRGYTHRSKLIAGLAFGSYNKKFAKENDVHSWLTRDVAVRHAYDADPFCHFSFTAAGYETLFSLLHTVSKKDWAGQVPKDLPILLFAGDMDPVGNYGKGVRAVYDRLKRAGADAHLKLYEGGRHEMHNETCRDEVFADLLAFSDNATGGRA